MRQVRQRSIAERADKEIIHKFEMARRNIWDKRSECVRTLGEGGRKGKVELAMLSTRVETRVEERTKCAVLSALSY